MHSQIKCPIQLSVEQVVESHQLFPHQFCRVTECQLHSVADEIVGLACKQIDSSFLVIELDQASESSTWKIADDAENHM